MSFCNVKITELEDKKSKLLDLRVEGKIKISDEEFISTNEKYKIQIVELKREVSVLFSPV